MSTTRAGVTAWKVVWAAAAGGVPFARPLQPGDTRIQVDFSPMPSRNWSPVSVWSPAEPRSTTCVARPPHSPSPLRLVTSTLSSAPMAGHFDWMVATGTSTVQLWWGDTSSPASTTDGNRAPAVRPPVDDEYIADTGAPPRVRITPAVSATAWFDVAASSGCSAAPTAARLAMPP